LKVKKRQKEEEVMYIEDTKERLVTEIEMLKVVLYLVSRSKEVEKEKEEKEMILLKCVTKEKSERDRGEKGTVNN
jgi:hypothetical protein